MNNICFIIFAHCSGQSVDDINDMIDNIKHFSPNSEIIINHPTINHPNIISKHDVGPVNNSSFIFGAFDEVLKNISEEFINKFDHFCLFSANQYVINSFNYQKNVNYVQFYNTSNWNKTYKGKDSDCTYHSGALRQGYGLWDDKDMYKVFGIEKAMASNWENATLTKEAMISCKQNIEKAKEIYPNCDLISLFPGYMALMTKQEYRFAPFFGCFDPSSENKDHLLSINQINQKKQQGYFSIKRVNYSKDCNLKEYIRYNLY